jgi:hypothetical protein
LRNFNTITPINIINNDWKPALKLSNSLQTGNGTNGNVTGSANDNRTIDAIRFVNFSLPDGFNFLRREH